MSRRRNETHNRSYIHNYGDSLLCLRKRDSLLGHSQCGDRDLVAVHLAMHVPIYGSDTILKHN